VCNINMRVSLIQIRPKLQSAMIMSLHFRAINSCRYYT
jgi:hypothetical protein